MKMIVPSMKILFVCALIACAVGFKKFVWFMSVGYGLAVCAIGCALLVIYRSSLTVITGIMCVLMIIYGARLGLFLLFRELKNEAYRKTLDKVAKTDKPVPIFVKVAMWITMSILYVMQTSAVTYRLANGAQNNLFAYVGAAVMLIGICMEALSDKQKSAAKKINPKRFCDTGLFKIVRCPNYFGEILFWTGVLISGIGAMKGAQYVIAILGWLMIFYIMVAGSRRLELRQNKSYGDDPEYQAYVKKVPLIFPFVPIYSLAKYEWLKG